MNLAYAHLLVNHAPVFATLFALPMLALVAWRHDDGMWRAAVLLLVVGGLSAVAADQTGDGAAAFLEHRVTLSDAAVHEHEERADVAMILTLASAVVGSVAYRRRLGRERLALAATSLLAITAAAALAWTAHAGGAIRHPEEQTAP